MSKVTVKVTLERPPEASDEDILNYVWEAVSTWNGQLRPPGGYNDDDPGDSMWPLDQDSVKVKKVSR